jgi:hypothetical protein
MVYSDPQDPGVVKRVVLTGGPCGGKSTLQTLLNDICKSWMERLSDSLDCEYL